MNPFMRMAVAVTALALGLPAGGAADEAGERTRIATERRAAEQRFELAERECRTRFAVTDCLEAAQRERREALMRLRGEETVLDEAQRKQRAAERLEAIRRKVSEESQAARPPAGAREPRAPSEPAPRVRVRDSAESADAPASAAGPLQRGRVTVRPKAQAASSAAERAAQEARSRAAYEARQQSAQEHVEENRRRNEERAKGKPAAPLPAASAASR